MTTVANDNDVSMKEKDSAVAIERLPTVDGGNVRSDGSGSVDADEDLMKLLKRTT